MPSEPSDSCANRRAALRIDRQLASLGGIWQDGFAEGSYDTTEMAILDDDDLGGVFDRVRKAVESKVGDGDEM